MKASTDGLIRMPVPAQYGRAWLLRASDGGPVRPIANGRRHRPVGSFFSVKNGRMLAWESKLELHSLWRAEVRTDVVESSVQPYMLEMLVDGKKCFYTCDRKDLLANGNLEIVEVKDAIEVEKDPLYYGKLKLAAEVYTSCGWSFRIEDRAEIEAEPAFSAIRTIVSYARTMISTADSSILHRVFAGRQAIPLEEIQTALGSGVHGLAAVCALVVQPRLNLDPADGLKAHTPVSLTPRTGGSLCVGI